MVKSETLYWYFENKEPSIDAINRLLPVDIFPEFRDKVTSLLLQYELSTISEEVKDAINSWNKRILAVWNLWDEKKNIEMQKASNNTNYWNEQLLDVI